MISMDATIFNPLSIPFPNPTSQFPSNTSINVSSDSPIPFCTELKLNPRICNKKGKLIANAYAVDGRFERLGKRDADELLQERHSWERKVNCEVEVISWRERRIKAEISVNADIDSVWHSLTDYERLADYVPNLVSSGRIPCPYPGRLWVEQRGFQRALYWHIEARVVLDLQEFPNSSNERELHFSMVDGDFKKFEGKWSVKSKRRSSSTTLSYEVNVIPKFNFPAIFLERIIRSDLPVNLRALACRSESNLGGNQKIPVTVNSKTETYVDTDSTSLSSTVMEKNRSSGELKKNLPGNSPGPLPQVPAELSSTWGVFGKVCRLDRPCLVDEIHLRRFDGLLENGGVHRCVIASITVKAPVHEVWGVLTAYESLPEVVPNLAISKVLSRDKNKVRILQEGCKGLLYMVLHARVVMDLCEQHEQEISFQQVEGDFDSFQGRWQLEQLGNHHTLLKYSVESKMRRDTVLSEAIMEEVIYEDLPSNLGAIRDYVEKRTGTSSDESDEPHTEHQKDENSQEKPCTSSEEGNNGQRTKENNSSSKSSSSTKQRSRVPGLQQDIEVLKSEILKFVAEHGQEGFMPMRKHLRSHGRVDIEKAINRMGGFRRIATLMNLSLAYKHRKPKGYWDNLENLQEEISRFQKSWGMDPSYMPSRKSFERAGRYDIARALEKWGGLHEVSRLLSLKLRHPNRQQASLSRDKKNDSVSSNVEVGEKLACKPFVALDPQDWLTNLKDLDITWVE